jgi:hypothetical protein
MTIPTRTVRLALPALLTTMLALTGCATSGGADDAGSSADSGAESGDGVLRDAAAPGDRPGTAPEKGPGRARTPVTTQAVISTGNVSLHSDDVTQARFDLQKVIDAAGGTVSEEEASTGDDGRLSLARLVVRVPSERFGETMTAIEKVAELDASSRGSEDVTTQVIDNDVRIRAQAKSLERIEALLAEATDLGDIVSIESQLTRRQADLDSLKSQQAYLRDQASLSTITVHLERSPEASTDDANAAGFGGGLESGWSALVTVAGGIATLLGAVLPFAVVGLVLGAPAWLLVRRARGRRPAAAQPE